MGCDNRGSYPRRKTLCPYNAINVLKCIEHTPTHHPKPNPKASLLAVALLPCNSYTITYNQPVLFGGLLCFGYFVISENSIQLRKKVLREQTLVRKFLGLKTFPVLSAVLINTRFLMIFLKGNSCLNYF